MKYRDIPSQMSASVVSAFSDCEQKLAFERLIEDVPVMPVPIQMVYGLVIHTAHKRIWKQKLRGKTPLTERTTRGWMGFINKVFDGKHGPEGESALPAGIRWLTPAEKNGLSEGEMQELINKKKKNYRALGWLAFEAIRLECSQPQLFREVMVEVNFTRWRVTIKSPQSNIAHPLSGRIDRIQIYNDGSYEIVDLKTGSAVRTYQRNKLVRDIQMTLYDLACRTNFGRPPRMIFIQPLPPNSIF